MPKGFYIKRKNSVAQDVRRFIATCPIGHRFTFTDVKKWMDANTEWQKKTNVAVSAALGFLAGEGILHRGEWAKGYRQHRRIWRVRSRRSHSGHSYAEFAEEGVRLGHSREDLVSAS